MAVRGRRRQAFGLYMVAQRVAFVALAAALLGCASTSADRAPAYDPARTAEVSAPISVVVEAERGGAFPTYGYGESLFVAGEEGSRYAIRLVNHTSERYEAVVTVDGRDVVSGDVGNYKKQRGYIIEPYDEVLVEGFRQSLDDVAAFRFSSASSSYSARRGTPQHTGVIGVAVFEERAQRDRPKPLSKYGAAPAPEPFPGRARRAESGVAAESAPLDDYDEEPSHDLGTAYGETDFSPVRETEFKRRRHRRPDGVLTVYYDSEDNLRYRGVIPGRIDPYAPRRAVDDGFAPPP